MVIEIDHEKCTLCGTFVEPVCVERCPCDAVRINRDVKRIEVTEFLCEDCNECGFACPDEAITIVKVTF
jgi:MinD superfamily P-loop ATPase